MKGRKNLPGLKKEGKLQTGPNKEFSLHVVVHGHKYQWVFSVAAELNCIFASTSMSLGSVEQQGLGDGHMLMGSRRRGRCVASWWRQQDQRSLYGS
jgi:hypothetical protein